MLGVHLDIGEYLGRIQSELDRLDPAEIQSWADHIYEAYDAGKFVYFIGNGGSGTSATHMCEDLGKSSLPESELGDESRKRLKVLSLTDNMGWILALGNDVGYDQIFVQQLMNFGQPGDVLMAISGSGNSPNILAAVDWANRHGLETFGITGFDGGKLKQMARSGFHVPLDDMGMVESLHLSAFHWVLNEVFARINAQGRHADVG